MIPTVALEEGHEEEDRLLSSHRQDLETGKNIRQAKNHTGNLIMYACTLKCFVPFFFNKKKGCLREKSYRDLIKRKKR